MQKSTSQRLELVGDRIETLVRGLDIEARQELMALAWEVKLVARNQEGK